MRIVCPMCQRVIEEVPEDFPPRPFCSPRCKLGDLSNWMNEVYRAPCDEQDGEEALN